MGGVSHVFAVSAVNEVGAGGHSITAGPVKLFATQDVEVDGSNDIIRLKMRSFEQDYERGEEIWRYTAHTHTLPPTGMEVYCTLHTHTPAHGDGGTLHAHTHTLPPTDGT